MPFVENSDPEVPSRIFRIESSEKMKKKDWLAEGKPSWWIRLGKGTAFRFLKMDQECPGNKPFVYDLDLDKHYVPIDETIYFGVGSPDKGIRDEYPRGENASSRLVWYKKPRAQEAAFSQWHVWWTKCYRYRIVRSVPIHFKKGEAWYYQEDYCFAASYGTSLLLCRTKTLAECHDFIIKDMMKRFGVIDVKDNFPVVLAYAAQKGLDYLPDLADELKTEAAVTTVKKKEKEEKPAKEKGPSVIKELIGILQGTSAKKPITKQQLLSEMMEKFPDKPATALLSTITARLGDLPKRHGIKLKSSKKGWWVQK